MIRQLMVDSNVSDGGDVDHVAIEIANISSSPTSTNNEKKTKSSFHPDPHIPWTTSLVPSREQRDVEFDQDALSSNCRYRTMGIRYNFS